MTTTVNNANSTISVSQYLQSIEELTNSNDISFLVFKEQVQGLDKQISDSLADVRTSGLLRDAFSKKLKALREMKALVSAVKSDGKTKVSLEQMKTEYMKQCGKEGQTCDWEAFRATFDAAQAEPRVGPDGTVSLERDPTQTMMSLSGDDIDGRIATVKDQTSKVDANRELGMIMMNTWMNKKSNAISQLTNLIKAHHDTEKSVINGLRV